MKTDLIKNILHYLLNEYPYPEDLTKTRITKLVYLIDCKSVHSSGQHDITITWPFDHYVPCILDIVYNDSTVKIRKTTSAYGGTKYVVEPKDHSSPLPCTLDEEEKKLVDMVIEDTKDLTWNKFIDFIYSTYPISKN